MSVRVATTNVAFRQRGYQDAIAKRPSHPPEDPEQARLYRNGYITAERELRKRESGEVER